MTRSCVHENESSSSTQECNLIPAEQLGVSQEALWCSEWQLTQKFVKPTLKKREICVNICVHLPTERASHLACMTAMRWESSLNQDSMSLQTLHNRSRGGAKSAGQPSSLTRSWWLRVTRRGSDKLNTCTYRGTQLRMTNLCSVMARVRSS
jgi:hypothetical protein